LNKLYKAELSYGYEEVVAELGAVIVRKGRAVPKTLPLCEVGAWRARRRL
jgi:hypothetical protein